MEAVHVLLSEGVDRSVQNPDGLRALQIATAFGYEDIKQVLLRAATVLLGAAGIDDSGTGSEVAELDGAVGRSSELRTLSVQARAAMIFVVCFKFILWVSRIGLEA